MRSPRRLGESFCALTLASHTQRPMSLLYPSLKTSHVGSPSSYLALWALLLYPTCSWVYSNKALWATRYVITSPLEFYNTLSSHPLCHILLSLFGFQLLLELYRCILLNKGFIIGGVSTKIYKLIIVLATLKKCRWCIRALRVHQINSQGAKWFLFCLCKGLLCSCIVCCVGIVHVMYEN